jgi:hypothetical protein
MKTVEPGTPISKKMKPEAFGGTEAGQDEDCISHLPDVVLGDIISLLPTIHQARRPYPDPRHPVAPPLANLLGPSQSRLRYHQEEWPWGYSRAHRVKHPISSPGSWPPLLPQRAPPAVSPLRRGLGSLLALIPRPRQSAAA